MNKNDRAFEALKSRAWAAPLLREVESRGGIRKAPAGILFELRFAYEAHLALPDASIQYEVKTGVGDSSIDFLLPAVDMKWLVELVNLDESKTVTRMRRASRTPEAPGVFSEVVSLASDNEDKRATPFGELVRVAEKIEEKVWDAALNQPRKFPAMAGLGHVLVVNLAGFEGADEGDCRELVYGPAAVPADMRTNSGPPDFLPMASLFDPKNTRPGSVAVQQRIDIIAFVGERPEEDDDDDDEIRRTILLLPNKWTGGQYLTPKFPLQVAEEQRDPLYRSRS